MTRTFSICPQCGRPLGPWTLPESERCTGHEKYVPGTDIDYPDQKPRKDHKGWVKGPRVRL